MIRKKDQKTKQEKGAQTHVIQIRYDADAFKREFDENPDNFELVEPDEIIGEDTTGDQDGEQQGSQGKKPGNAQGGESLKLYFNQINQIPLLSREEENECAVLLRTGTADERQAARERFITSNLRLVAKIAQSYRGRGLKYADLISEGNLGLMQAVDKFDPTLGAKFSTYAAAWIKQSMGRALRTQLATIRIPQQAQMKIEKISAMSRRFEQEHGRRPTTKEIADALGFKESTVARLQLSKCPVESLDEKVTNGDGGTFTRMEIIPDRATSDPSERLEEQEHKKLLARCLQKLKPQERQVLEMRFGLGGTSVQPLDEISRRIARTRERVRQIQIEAIEKLRKMMDTDQRIPDAAPLSPATR